MIWFADQNKLSKASKSQHGGINVKKPIFSW